MNTAKYKSYIRLLGLILVLILPLYLLQKSLRKPQEYVTSSGRAEYVGKDACKSCHLQAYNDWVGSHHDRAMAIANDSTVLGNFNNQQMEAQGFTHKMYKRDGKFFVETDGEDGQLHEFEVKYTFGYTPLQQYLVEFDGGKLQTLPLTWNTVDSCWYHMVDSVYQHEEINADNWLHWTNQAQNWNSMCAECHSTNLQKNYDYTTDTYHTTYSEINVSCEACHGAGSKHVEWANLPEYSQEQIPNYGLEVQTSNIDQQAYVNLCARCHSRKSSLGDFDPGAASTFDYMIPAVPDEPNWHIDGQIKEEDYVYASFLQSKMYHREIKCSDCHNVHSGERLFEGNKLCLQCHNAEQYDTYEHHHHKAAGQPGETVISESGVRFDVGSGTECVNCHMHGQYYMGVDYRNDHSFRIPRPDLSIKYGTKNACNQCHANESNQWSLNYVNKWYGASKRRHYVEAFAAAKALAPDAVQQLRELVNNDQYPTIIRARGLQELTRYFPDSVASIAESYYTNQDPMLRFSAIHSIAQVTTGNIPVLTRALNDPTKAIRIEASRIIQQTGADLLPSNYRELYQKTLAEYRETLEYTADFPTGRLNLAGYLYAEGQVAEAEKAYRKALEMDSELDFVNLNLAYIYNQTNRKDEAEKQFREYLQANPKDADTYFSLALLVSDLGRYDESLNLMLQAHELDPSIPRLNHNIAMMYDFKKDYIKAEQFLKEELRQNASENAYLGLLQFYVSHNYLRKAYELTDDISRRYPDNQDVANLRKQLEARL